jgi:two-component system chemotaxis response regulator CheY
MARFYLVDDSLFVLTQLKQILEKGGHEVVDSAQSGEMALQFLEERAREIEVVTIDITMPGADGMTILDRIHQKWPAIITLIVSGLAKRDLVLEAGRLGASGYLIKPLVRERVLEKIAEVLKEQTSGEGSA